MVRSGEDRRVPDAVERFAKTLVITAKAVALYPSASDIPLQTAEDAVDALRQALRTAPIITLSVSKDGLWFEGTPLFSGSAAYRSFAAELYLRSVADIRFRSGTSARDLVALLSALRYEAEELEAMGGVEGRLWDRGVTSITVTRPQVAIVTAEETDAGEVFGRDEVRAALAAAAAGDASDLASEQLAIAARELGLEGLCDVLLEDFDESSASREGIARALRTIALVSNAGRDDVLAAAVSGLRQAGASEPYIAGVSEAFAPSRVASGADATTPAAPESADAVMRLVGLGASASSVVEGSGDEEFEALADEARRGVTDGDVIMALVSLLVLGGDDELSASVARALDDALEVLVELGEIDVAADVADALAAAKDDVSASPEQRRRLEAAAAKLSRASDLRRVIETLRLHPDGSPEHEAARRFIDALGPVAIRPLLEELAEETDMATRKALVGVLSGLAPGHVQDFGSHLNDPRWYVVRNVVSILGATHSADTLSSLTRTLRHPDARVRRETIRALSGIQDRRANDLLVAALSDEDAQNVQLAARYLGTSGAKEALGELEQVARGEGKGNRENGPRVEAIESIARIGDPAALATLDAIVSKRTLLRSAKTSDVRSAAQSAAERIRKGRG